MAKKNELRQILNRWMTDSGIREQQDMINALTYAEKAILLAYALETIMFVANVTNRNLGIVAKSLAFTIVNKTAESLSDEAPFADPNREMDRKFKLFEALIYLLSTDIDTLTPVNVSGLNDKVRPYNDVPC